jgi:CsoR family transcriptional regulator, copper-sensing transcriptional repressor
MAHNTQKVQISIKKASTLLSRVLKMIEDDKYCPDIIHQNLSVIGLLRSANEQLLEGHLGHCFKEAMQSDNAKKQQQMTDELLKILKTAQKK